MTERAGAGDEGGMKSLMTDWIVPAAALCLAVPLLACDAKSTEIGATVGEETTGEVMGTSSGDVETASTGGATDPCAALDQQACEAADLLDDIECAWVDVQTSDGTCSEGEGEGVGGRCIASESFGDGCLETYACVDGMSVFTRDLGDGIFEWFTLPAPCGAAVLDYEECRYDGSDAAPCACLCEGLGGSDAEPCNPLGTACPDAQGTSQECEPTASGESWICVPQFAGTSPGYGDECWPEDSPAVACTGQTICLPAEGLGVADCDGGDGGGCCTQLCDLDAGASCPDDGQICSPFYTDGDAPVGYERVGVCRLE